MIRTIFVRFSVKHFNTFLEAVTYENKTLKHFYNIFANVLFFT